MRSATIRAPTSGKVHADLPTSAKSAVGPPRVLKTVRNPRAVSMALSIFSLEIVHRRDRREHRGKFSFKLFTRRRIPHLSSYASQAPYAASRRPGPRSLL